MSDARPALLSIGQFALAAQLSLKALRLYHRLDLLAPAFIEPSNGYRYYLAEQIHTARLIRTLRAMEMPLAQIRALLSLVAGDPAAAEAQAAHHLRSLEQRLQRAQAMSREFTRLIRLTEAPMSLRVENITLAPQWVASLSRRVRVQQLDQAIRQGLANLRDYAAGQTGQYAGAPFGIYHGPINEKDDGPIEICLPLEAALQPAGEIQVYELPGGAAVRVDLHGRECDFPTILQAYEAAAEWISRRGYQVAGSPRELWYSEPGETAHMQVVWLYRN